eukprot:3391867-Alexandrium_andersonii.AAC.1
MGIGASCSFLRLRGGRRPLDPQVAPSGAAAPHSWELWGVGAATAPLVGVRRKLQQTPGHSCCYPSNGRSAH